MRIILFEVEYDPGLWIGFDVIHFDWPTGDASLLGMAWDGFSKRMEWDFLFVHYAIRLYQQWREK